MNDSFYYHNYVLIIYYKVLVGSSGLFAICSSSNIQSATNKNCELGNIWYKYKSRTLDKVIHDTIF